MHQFEVCLIYEPIVEVPYQLEVSSIDDLMIEIIH